MEDAAAGDLLMHPPKMLKEKAEAAALRSFLLQLCLARCFHTALLMASWSLLCVSASIPVDQGVFSHPVLTISIAFK